MIYILAVYCELFKNDWTFGEKTYDSDCWILGKEGKDG